MRHTSIIAFMIVLLSASAASAECAWVLWVQYEFFNVSPGKLIDRGNWTMEAAMPTYAGCIDAARNRAERQSGRRPEAVNVKDIRTNALIGGGFQVRTEFIKPEPSSSSVTFRCFPDTVRPQE